MSSVAGLEQILHKTSLAFLMCFSSGELVAVLHFQWNIVPLVLNLPSPKSQSPTKNLQKKQTSDQQWSLAYCGTIHKLKENYVTVQQH